MDSPDRQIPVGAAEKILFKISSGQKSNRRGVQNGSVFMGADHEDVL